MYILGLDCSTTACGWCIFKDNDLIEFGVLNLSIYNTNHDKLMAINALIYNFNINFNKVIIESPNKYGVNANTTALLLIFNTMVQVFLIYNLELPVYEIVCTTARKNVFGKAIPKKEVQLKIFNYYPFLNDLKLTKPHKSDVADAIVLVLSELNIKI